MYLKPSQHIQYINMSYRHLNVESFIKYDLGSCLTSTSCSRSFWWTFSSAVRGSFSSIFSHWFSLCSSCSKYACLIKPMEQKISFQVYFSYILKYAKNFHNYIANIYFKIYLHKYIFWYFLVTYISSYNFVHFIYCQSKYTFTLQYTFVQNI